VGQIEHKVHRNTRREELSRVRVAAKCERDSIRLGLMRRFSIRENFPVVDLRVNSLWLTKLEVAADNPGAAKWSDFLVAILCAALALPIGWFLALRGSVVGAIIGANC
jgi:hypothetical protein